MKTKYILLFIGYAIVGLDINTFGQTNIKRQEISSKYSTPALIEFYPSSQSLGSTYIPPISTMASISSTINGNILSSYLSIPVGNTLTQIVSTTDKFGITTIKYQQYYNTIKVEGGVYYVTLKDGYVLFMNGSFKPVAVNTTTTPSINESAALSFAKKALSNSTQFATTAPAELVFIDPQLGGGGTLLAYKFIITATLPTMQSYYIYVNANNGSILFQEQIIRNCFSDVIDLEIKKKNIKPMMLIPQASWSDSYSLYSSAQGTLATRYSGSISTFTDSYNGSFRLRDYTRGQGIEVYNAQNKTLSLTSGGMAFFPSSDVTDFTDNNNNWTQGEYDNVSKDNVSLDVFMGLQNTYDYFKIVHQRNGIDNANMLIKAYIHVAMPDGNNVNAFWNQGGAIDGGMFYGDGYANVWGPITTQDVTSHELAHGICQATANLIYSNESGALNEALSDIWGATVEKYFFNRTISTPSKKTWLIGEEADLINKVGFRSMSDPNTSKKPNTYLGKYWYLAGGDNGGVHSNSSVINYFYYLLSEGGTGTNDFGIAYNVPKIGIDIAADIIYFTENHLVSNSNFLDFSDITKQATKTLYGETSAQYTAVVEALKAVGLTAPLLAAQLAVPIACKDYSNGSMSYCIGIVDNYFLPTGLTQISSTYTNDQVLYYQECSPQLTTDLKSYILTTNPNAKITIESSRKIQFVCNANRIDQNGQNKGDSYVRLVVNENGKITLRACSSYTPSSARMANNEVVSNKKSVITTENKLILKSFPNPANDNFNIFYQLPGSSDVVISLYNNQGQEIDKLAKEINQDAGEYIIGYDTKYLNNGMYFIKIITNNTTKTTKIYVQK